MLPQPYSMPTFGGYAPLATGSTYQPFNMFGNSFGGGLLGMGMQTLGQPILQQAMSQQGMFPLGFGHSQNMYDVAQRLRFQQMYQQAMDQTRSAEQMSMIHTMRGMAHLAGTPWNASTYQSAAALSKFAAGAAPMLAHVAPDILEGLGGRVGSATLLTSNLMLGGRYRVDPVTGQMGMSAESASAVSRDIMSTVYGTGDAQRMHGVTAGRLGQAFDELTRRGLVPQVDRSAAIGQITGQDVSRMSGAQLDTIAMKPEVSAQLRAFDAKKIKDTLQKYSQTISAMREIFGDNGNPNAPMSELLLNLDRMTMGGMSQLSPDKLTNMVRSTHNLAKASGIPLDVAMGLTQQGAVFAHQMGLSPLFGAQFAQGSMSFHSALQGMVPTWGMLDRNALTQLDMTKRAGAAGSEMANRLGAMMRLREAKGGFAAGSQAEKLARSIERGEPIADMHMTANDFDAMMQNVGFSSGQIRTALAQTVANEEPVHRHKIGDIVRDLQPTDAKRTAKEYIRNNVYGQLKDQGMSHEKAWDLAEKAAEQGSETVFGMSRGMYADTKKRDRLIGQAIRDATGGELKTDIGTIGSLAHGALDQATLSGEFGPNQKNFSTVRESMRPETLAAARRQRQLDQARQQFQTPLSRFAQPDTTLGNLIGGLQSLRKGETMKDYIMRAMGGVDMGDVQNSLVAPLTQIRDLQTKFDKALKDFERDPSAANQEKLNQISGQLTAKAGPIEALDAIKGAGDLYNTMGPKVAVTARTAIKDFEEYRKIFRSKVGKDDRSKFWGSASGKLMREAAGNMMGSVDNLLTAAVTGDDFILKKGGRRGLDAAKTLQSARDKLKDLADRYAGGDMSKLLAGDLNLHGKEGAEVQDEIRSAIQDVRHSTNTLTELDAKPVKAGQFKGQEADLKAGLQGIRDKLDPKELFRQMLSKKIGKERADELIASGKMDKGIEALGKDEKTMREMRLVLGGRREGLGAAGLLDDSKDIFKGSPEQKAEMMQQKVIAMAEEEAKKKEDATASGETASAGSMKLSGELIIKIADNKGELRNATGKTLKAPGAGDAAAG